jgi:hypothetical protein
MRIETRACVLGKCPFSTKFENFFLQMLAALPNVKIYLTVLHHCVCGVYKYKWRRLPSHKQVYLLFKSQHVSAQIGGHHHQMILEKYKNRDGIHVNYNASIKFC